MCQNRSFFLVKSFLGNSYRHLAIFFWSHCPLYTILDDPKSEILPNVNKERSHEFPGNPGVQNFEFLFMLRMYVVDCKAT